MSAQQSCLSGLQSAAQRGLSEEISGALRSSPYYFVLRGSPPTEDPAPSLVLIEEVVRACGAVPRHKICFTRIKIDPLQALFKGNSTRLSRTRNAMPPHTDSSYETEPHELVVFQIVRADPAGGETILVPVDAVVGHLAAEAAAALSEPVFPFGSATHPILAPHEAGVAIRYYRQQINRSLGANATLSDRQVNAMAALDLEIGKARNQIRRKLYDGDLLFLNNRKVLHGRTALPSDSRRLLFRFRARIPGGL